MNMESKNLSELSLYRQEAIDARRSRVDNAIILKRPSHLTAYTVGIFSMLAAVGIWTGMNEMRQTISIAGEAVSSGDRAKIVNARPGIIASLSVREGERVVRGSPLLRIAYEQDDANNPASIAHRLSLIDKQIADLHLQKTVSETEAGKHQSSLEDAANLAETEVSLVAQQASLQEDIVTSTASSFNAVETLAKKGYASRLTLEQRKQAWLAASSQLAQLKQQLASARGKLTVLVDNRRAEKVANESRASAMTAQISDLTLRKLDLISSQGTLVTSPIAGRVTALQAYNGKQADGRSPLMMIVPTNPQTRVRLYVPANAASSVVPGQMVRLEVDGQKTSSSRYFDGKIIETSGSTLRPDEIETSLALKQPSFLVDVELINQPALTKGEAIRPGTLVVGRIVVRARPYLRSLMGRLLGAEN
jgi:membrane fusion protein